MLSPKALSGVDESKNDLEERRFCAFEEALRELAARKDEGKDTAELPDALKEYLSYVADTGRPLFDWQLVKNVLYVQADNAFRTMSDNSDLASSNSSVEQLTAQKKRIQDGLLCFDAAPFTIQRVCELLLKPSDNYKRLDKYLRALEKNISVVSTVDSEGRRETDCDKVHINGALGLNRKFDEVDLIATCTATLENCPPPEVTSSSSSCLAASGRSDECTVTDQTEHGSTSSTPMPSIEALWHSTFTSSGTATALSALTIASEVTEDGWKNGDTDTGEGSGIDKTVAEDSSSIPAVAAAAASESENDGQDPLSKRPSEQQQQQAAPEPPWKKLRAAPLDA